MKNYKLQKTAVAYLLAGTTLLTVGCGKSNNKNNSEVTVDTTSYETQVDNYYEDEVKSTFDGIETLLPGVNDDISSNSTIVLLLELLAPKDENGKINADIISNYKNILDVDNIMDDFNSFLDLVESSAIDSKTVKNISLILPDSLNNDKIILKNIESILNNLIVASNNGNKDLVNEEFDKLYKLFGLEDELTIDGVTFKVRDLTLGSREVANMYAEVASNYFAKGYVDEDKRSAMDSRTNDQNAKAYIKSRLEILKNEMDEVSEEDVIGIFSNKYNAFKNSLNSKINASDTQIIDLVNFINNRYLNSSKVSYKDRNTIFGGYSEQRITDALLLIDAINTFNKNNNDKMIAYSNLVIDGNETDKLALNFVQFNSIKLLESVDTISDYQTLRNNPYFNNLFLYFTKQDFLCSYLDENDNVISKKISWQEISDGVNFVNYETILSVLRRLPEIDNKNNYIEVLELNLGEAIQALQITITGECQKADIKDYVK